MVAMPVPGKPSTAGRSAKARSKTGDNVAQHIDCLENARVRGRAEKKVEKKDCDFACGIHNQMPDDFSVSRDADSPEFTPMRWAYPDGSGANCHACERIWQTELAHHWRGNRLDYKQSCKGDLELLEKHRQRRLAYVGRKQTRGQGPARRTAGVHKTKLKVRNENRTKLIKPRDQFYPYDDYVAQFGDPLLPCNKKKGHHVSKVNGVRGIVVPGEHTGKPWEIERTIEHCLIKDDELEGANSDSDVDAEILEDKYCSMVEQEDEAYAASAVGMVASILALCAQVPDEAVQKVNKPKTHKKRDALLLAPEVGENREVAGHHLAAGSDDDDAPASKTRRKVANRGGGAAVHRAGPAGGAARSGVAVAASSSASSSFSTPVKSEKPMDADRYCASVSPAASSVKHEMVLDSPPHALAVRSDVLQFDNEKTGAAGRPAANIESLTDASWATLCDADESSIFFGAKALAQSRSIGRYALKIGTKILSEKNVPRLRSLETTKKRLQVMDSLVKIYMAWEKRRSVEAGAAAFVQSWDAMITFCKVVDNADAIMIDCPFMQDIRLQVLVGGDQVRLAAALESPILQDDFASMCAKDALYIQNKQAQFLNQAFTHHLMTGKSLSDCKAGLTRFLGICSQHSAEYEKAIQEDLDLFSVVVDPPVFTFDVEIRQRLISAISITPQVAPKVIEHVRPYFLSLVRLYPKFGTDIVNVAMAAKDQHSECGAFWQYYRDQVQQLDVQIASINDGSADLATVCGYPQENAKFGMHKKAEIQDAFREECAGCYKVHLFEFEVGTPFYMLQTWCVKSLV